MASEFKKKGVNVLLGPVIGGLVSRTWTHDESGGEVPVRKTCVKVSCFGKV